MSALRRQSRFGWYLTAAFVAASVAGTVWLLFFNGLESIQSLMAFIDVKANAARNDGFWLFVYCCICIVSQLLVVPSGSLILIAAGFIFSPLLATVIFSLAQILCSWPVYKMGELVSNRYPDRFKLIATRFKVAPDWEQAVQKEGFIATIVLRLTPVIPSAAACLLAAGFGITLRKFIPATIAVCWIRPLFFASIGGSLQALSALPDALGATSVFGPLLLLAIASMVLLLAKLYTRYKA